MQCRWMGGWNVWLTWEISALVSRPSPPPYPDVRRNLEDSDERGLVLGYEHDRAGI